MTDFVASRPLRNLATGVDPRELGLKVLGSEAMGEFLRAQDFGMHTMRRGFNGAREAQFPIIGRATAAVHTPGMEILGDTIQTGERVIALEDLIIAPYFIANIDEILKSWDARAPYARAIGEILARRYNQDVAYTAINAARSASTIPGQQGHGDGGQLVNAAYATDGSVLFDGFFDAGVVLAEKDVPMDGVKGFVRPLQYAQIVQSDRPIDSDLNRMDNGSLAEGIVKRINGIPLVRTNNLVNEDQTGNALINAKRRQDYSPTVGVIYHKDAVGSLDGMPVMIEDETTVRHQGTLLVGKFFAGHDVLRPEAAVELRTS